MKTRMLTVVYSAIFGIFIWLLSSALNYYIFSRSTETFIGEVFKTSGHEIYIRAIMLFAFMVFGYIISRFILESRKAHKQLTDISEFPIENPNPVLRISAGQEVTYCNPSGKRILSKLYSTGEEKVPEKWFELAQLAQKRNMVLEDSIELGGKVYTISFVPVIDKGHTNLYGTDSTERLRVIDRLEKSEKFLLAAQDVADIGTWEWDSLKNTLVWSEKTYEIFGVSPSGFTPGFVEHLKFIPKEEQKAYRKNIDDALKSKKSFDYEVKISAGDGKQKYIWVQGEPLISETENVTGLWGTIQDITERKLIEEKIRKSEEELRWLLESMLNAFVIFESVFDDDHNFISYRFVYINDSYERITGVKNEEVKGKTVHEVWPGTEPEWIERYGSVAVTGKPQEFELYHEPTKKFYHCNAYRPFGTDEKFCVIFEDITERRQMLESLKESERLLSDVGDFAKIGGWEMDMENDGKATWTKATYDIVGIEYDKPVPGFDEHIGYYLPEYRDMVRKKMQDFVNTEKPLHFKAPLRTANGEIKWGEAYGEAIVQKGKVVKLRGTFQDITERHQNEERLREYREHLEELVDKRTKELNDSNKELEAFSFSVSHDLRAPLRSIEGFSQLLIEKKHQKLDEKSKDYLNRIIKASNNMSQLIEDILQLSRITRLDVNRTDIDLSQMAREISEDVRLFHNSGKAKVEISQGLKISADKDLMRIALRNLIDNAFKFSGKRPDPYIEIGYKEKNGHREYYIKDNGVGFDMNYKDKLFSPFQRLHSESEFPGTGVGLATVKRIIKKHGGKIYAESTLGKGAIFIFEIN